MAEWGKESDHDLYERTREQVRAVRHRGSSSLVRDHAYYTEKAADNTLPAKDRALWAQLRDEVADRLGLNAEQPEQDGLW